jgi:hypothetical protein
MEQEQRHGILALAAHMGEVQQDTVNGDLEIPELILRSVARQS